MDFTELAHCGYTFHLKRIDRAPNRCRFTRKVSLAMMAIIGLMARIKAPDMPTPNDRKEGQHT